MLDDPLVVSVVTRHGDADPAVGVVCDERRVLQADAAFQDGEQVAISAVQDFCSVGGWHNDELVATGLVGTGLATAVQVRRDDAPDNFTFDVLAPQHPAGTPRKGVHGPAAMLVVGTLENGEGPVPGNPVPENLGQCRG